jgi:hypothetical protein
VGNESHCKAVIDGERVEVHALLETSEVILRGDRRLVIPFREIRHIADRGGVLELRTGDHEVSLTLGRDAAKWAEKIRNPKSVIDKLGVRSGQRISAIGPFDPDFVSRLEGAGADVSRRLRKKSEVIFAAIDSRDGLGQFGKLRDALEPNGSIWIVRPKGVPEIREQEVMAAGKAAGLVDVKVVRFSDTHTAEKFVIPVARRR